jgi:hypothetical protein
MDKLNSLENFKTIELTKYKNSIKITNIGKVSL